MIAVATAASSTALVALPAAAHAGCISDRGYVYDVSSTSALKLDGFGTAKVFHNGTQNNATLSLSQTGSGTSEWSVNASLSATASYSFLVIKGSVTATVGGSYTTSNSESQTVTATITVKPGYYGILQGGVFRRPAYGHYYYDNGNCTFTSGEYIHVKLPVTTDGLDSATNTTGNVPWDQGKVG